jgi:hypothetical protein
MPIASVKTYLDQLDQVIDTAGEQHDDAQLASLGTVVDSRREDWQAVAADNSIEAVASQVVTVLDDADANLEPNQVETLEKHVHKRVSSR